LLIENRGSSWSVGGKSSLEKITTMPNILKKYSPNLRGYSLYDNFLQIPALNKNSFNVAVSGNEAHNMPAQAKDLIQRIKNDKKVNFEKDWKLVTMFIGGNDLCRFCKDPALRSPENYVKFIREALDLLHDQLPRTFVNLVSMFRASEIQKLNGNQFCTLFHKIGCKCAAFADPKIDDMLNEYNTQYLNYTHSLIDSNRYDDRDDFTVVIQEFMQDMKIPLTSDNQTDYTYFAPDCFHFSAKGHAKVAIELWNSMFTPVNQKTTEWNLNQDIQCPTLDKPYLYTRKNSI
jgi:phospholipase B1